MRNYCDLLRSFDPLRTSSTEYRHECNVCHKSYKNKRHLYRHQKGECIGVEPKFKCEICCNLFRRKYHLSRHMVNRHGVKQEIKIENALTPEVNLQVTENAFQRFTCDRCGRSYKHKTNLCNHKREECGKPPSYFCPVCEKGFKKKQHLQRHLVVHSDFDVTVNDKISSIRQNLPPQLPFYPERMFGFPPSGKPTG
ncbi:unnamed protein product [Phyllotreta striolata]|uniref:C2H2-type domain-containing protein n=1 Tax=Phyllotreta striolata TaxID=444603 RepID=A0A9N9TW78_PHYSR|nr:unnamed protein product [Phyllotreta striolata]